MLVSSCIAFANISTGISMGRKAGRIQNSTLLYTAECCCITQGKIIFSPQPYPKSHGTLLSSAARTRNLILLKLDMVILDYSLDLKFIPWSYKWGCKPGKNNTNVEKAFIKQLVYRTHV